MRERLLELAQIDREKKKNCMEAGEEYKPDPEEIENQLDEEEIFGSGMILCIRTTQCCILADMLS